MFLKKKTACFALFYQLELRLCLLNSAHTDCVHKFKGRLFGRRLLMIEEITTKSLAYILWKDGVFKRNSNIVPKSSVLSMFSSIFGLVFIYSASLPFLPPSRCKFWPALLYWDGFYLLDEFYLKDIIHLQQIAISVEEEKVKILLLRSFRKRYMITWKSSLTTTPSGESFRELSFEITKTT